MANAKKCDRCGLYYDKNVAKPYCGVVVSGIAFVRNSDGSAIYDTDLCDECINKLKRFLDGDELVDTED